MVEATSGKTGWDAWSQEQADAARERHNFRVFRLRRDKEENDTRLAAKAAAKLKAVEAEAAMTPDEKAAQERKRTIIQAAMERARLQKEKLATQAQGATGLNDVSRAVRRQIEEINSKLEEEAKNK